MRTTVERECEWCHKPFHVEPWRFKSGRGRFCSRSCGNRFHLTGKPSRAFKSGRIAFQGGYIAVLDPSHPNATVVGGRYVFEHRKVASEMLGRPLDRQEIVHHVNSDTADNRPENLQVMMQSEHARLHGKARMMPRGEKNPRAKLSNAQVGALRQAFQAGASTKELATTFGICYSRAWALATGHARREDQ